MNVVDILVAIVVVTILVTIILAIVTYVAYKLRLSREPMRPEDDPTALRYFTPYRPAAGQGGAGRTSAESTLERLDRDVASLGDHATQA